MHFRNAKSAKKEDEKPKSKWVNPVRQYSDAESDAEYSVYSEESSSEEEEDADEDDDEEEDSEEEVSSDDDYHSLSAASMKKANSTGLGLFKSRSKKNKKSYSTTQPTSFNPTRGMFGKKKSKKAKDAEEEEFKPRKLKTDKNKLSKNKNPFGPPKKSESLLKMEAKKDKKSKKEKSKKERAPGLPGMFGLKKKQYYEDREYIVVKPEEKKSKKKSKKAKKDKKVKSIGKEATEDDNDDVEVKGSKSTDAAPFVMGTPAYLASEAKQDAEVAPEVAVATPVNMTEVVHTPVMQNTESVADVQMETPVMQSTDDMGDIQVQTPVQAEASVAEPVHIAAPPAVMSSSTVDVPGALPAGNNNVSVAQPQEQVYTQSYTTQAPVNNYTMNTDNFYANAQTQQQPVSNYADAQTQQQQPQQQQQPISHYANAQTQPGMRTVAPQSNYVNESCGPDEPMFDDYSDDRASPLMANSAEMRYIEKFPTAQSQYTSTAVDTSMGSSSTGFGDNSTGFGRSGSISNAPRTVAPPRSANRMSTAAIIPPPATYGMVISSSNKSNPRNLPTVSSNSQALAKLKAKGVKKMAPAQPTKRAKAEAKRKEKAKASRAKARAKAKAKSDKRNAAIMENYNNRDDDSVPRSYRKSRLSVSGMFGRSGSSSAVPVSQTIDESSSEEEEEDQGDKRERIKKSIISSFT